jgi:diguanylate cyclase (GGDEF)-like protein
LTVTALHGSDTYAVGPAGSLGSLQLAEFLAVVSAYPDAESATQAAVERAAEALEAEVGAAVWPDAATVVGFPAGRAPVAELRAAATQRDRLLEVPGAGPCHIAVVPLDTEPAGHLLLARAEDPFTGEEVGLMRAMARVLALTLVMVGTISAERRLRERSEQQAEENDHLVRTLQDRQRLMESLSEIERAIARHDPIQSILDTITTQARGLLGADAALLRMLDPDDAGTLVLASANGVAQSAAQELARVPLAAAEITPPSFDRADLPGGLCTAMAAAVRESDEVVGSLVVASSRPDHRFTPADRQTLAAFADHVSLAVTDARTVQAMHAAFHDALTGLATRALFLDRLAAAALRRDRPTVGLLFVDLDRFKIVNDTMGHAAGDALLVQVADRIRGCLRAGDTAARFGGDEFAALLWGADLEESGRVADRIIEAVRRPYLVNGRQVYINASIGIATGVAGECDADDLLRDADVAMYHAKRNGKGRRQVFEPHMHEELIERMLLEADLRRALERDELVLHYQPIISLDSGRVTGFEALLRWHRPGHGLVPPAQFVPLAEETGLIVPIGGWVLAEACRQADDWRRRFGPGTSIEMNVNLSARQLEQPGLVAEVAEVLARTQLPPSALVLEITETVLHSNVEAASATLGALKRLGIRLALDDFGTGYSSLSCLQQFPVDIIKIDRSFVESGRDGGRSTAFATAIVQLGQMLNLETVAEGIESTEHLDALRAARCEVGQGYLFSRPVPADQAAALLNRT